MMYLIKQKFLLFYLLFFSFTVFGQVSYELEGKIKIKSFGKTAQEMLQMYREIGASPQELAGVYMMLSFLGHPHYPAIVQSNNVCLMIYGSVAPEIDHKYVIMVKLQKGGIINLRQIVEGLGWVAEDCGDWTFFARSKGDFQMVGDKNALVQFASDEIGSDAEICIKPGMVSFIKLPLDKDFSAALGNLSSMVWNFCLQEGSIVLDGCLFYKKEGQENLLSRWLERRGNCWGLKSRVICENAKESKVQMSLERVHLLSFFNQWRASVKLKD